MLSSDVRTIKRELNSYTSNINDLDHKITNLINVIAEDDELAYFYEKHSDDIKAIRTSMQIIQDEQRKNNALKLKTINKLLNQKITD